MTGKKPCPRTEPMYSGGNRKDFPITTGYDSVEYGDLIGSHITEYDQNILICQSFHNGHFSGCFAPSKWCGPRPAVSWAIRNDNNSFFKLVRKNWKWKNGTSKQIYSLACDDNLGFAVFFMKGYGTDQCVVTNLSHIYERWKDGFKITACAARDSTFYIIMTKGTEKYSGRHQIWFISYTWWETYSKVNAPFYARFTVTGICYSTGLRQYFVVMTKKPEVQSSHYFDDAAAVINWMEEQHNVGYHPTLIFTDPTLEKTLVVMTADQNRSSYEIILHCKLK